jgi:hypothetical protein
MGVIPHNNTHSLLGDKQMDAKLSNIKIGKDKPHKIVRIEDVSVKTLEDGSERLYFETVADDGVKYKINEVFIRDHTGEIKIKGIWLNFDTDKQILYTSILGRILRHLNVESIGELIGREITIAPKDNNFMILVVDE